MAAPTLPPLGEIEIVSIKDTNSVRTTRYMRIDRTSDDPPNPYWEVTGAQPPTASPPPPPYGTGDDGTNTGGLGSSDLDALIAAVPEPIPPLVVPPWEAPD